LILDEDKPGYIAFSETVMEVSRKDKVAYVLIKRIDGSDGQISCIANTSNDLDSLPGKRAGIPNEDFVPIENKEIIFLAGELEMYLEIEMPLCEEKEDSSIGQEGADTVSFSV